MAAVENCVESRAADMGSVEHGVAVGLGSDWPAARVRPASETLGADLVAAAAVAAVVLACDPAAAVQADPDRLHAPAAAFWALDPAEAAEEVGGGNLACWMYYCYIAAAVVVAAAVAAAEMA